MKGLWNCLCKAALTVIFISLYLSCQIGGHVGSGPLPCGESPQHPPPPLTSLASSPGALRTAFRDLSHRFPSRWKLISWLGASLTLQLMETTSELL